MLAHDSPLRKSQKDDNIEMNQEKEEKRYSRVIEWM
jgi:hypothetical protein